MNTVNRIRCNINCTLETKGHICTVDIIINRLRKMNNIKSLFTKEICGLLGTVTAKDNKTIQIQLVISLLHRLYLIKSIGIWHTHLLKWLSG